ncbi:MAG TPA: hypothetical protein VGK67_08975 [Myxococcales bacterium]|jgi:hypothetical protein
MRRLSSCLLALALGFPRAAAAETWASQPSPAPAAVQAQPVAAPAPAEPAATAQPLPPPPPPPPAPAGETPPPPPPPVLMQPDPAQPAVMQPLPAQPVPGQPLPGQPGVMVPVPVQPQAPAPVYAARKMFHWGVGMSGGVGGGVSNTPGSAGFGLALLNVDGRFLIGTRMPDVGGGYLHAGLIDVHLGVRVGFTGGDYGGHTLFGPLWKAGGGLDLGYQLLKLRPFEPGAQEKVQTAIGVSAGISINYEYFGRALLASVDTGSGSDLTDKVPGGGLRESSFLLVGPFLELSTPKYDPVKGKLKQKFMRLMLLNGGNAMYQVSLTWGSTF